MELIKIDKYDVLQKVIAEINNEFGSNVSGNIRIEKLVDKYMANIHHFVEYLTDDLITKAKDIAVKYGQ